jgi:hypothetical protein
MVAEIKNWDRETITKWNKYRFPLNSQNKQIRKVEEEIAEFNREVKRDRKLEELADVYIAFAGLARFTSIGAFACKLFEQMPDFSMLHDAVKAKMIVNNKRVFDKNMHHIEDMAINEDSDTTHAPSVENPEYIKITKKFHYWKQDERGKWHRVSEPYTFTVIKSEYYKRG